MISFCAQPSGKNAIEGSIGDTDSKVKRFLVATVPGSQRSGSCLPKATLEWRGRAPVNGAQPKKIPNILPISQLPNADLLHGEGVRVRAHERGIMIVALKDDRRLRALVALPKA